MRRWEDSTFVFVSTNQRHEPGCVEERWLDVIGALTSRGATVRFLALSGSPIVEMARARGVSLDVYTLDAWNVIRGRSRLRKYLRRYAPVAAHSTGLEADLLLRWAARRVPHVAVVHTLAGERQSTRRRRPIEAMMRRFDELGMRSVASVFVDTEELAAEVRNSGVDATRVMVEPESAQEDVRLHVRLYQDLMAGRGAGERH